MKVVMPSEASMRENAEAVAISALAFIAADPELLPRFLALTGIEAGRLCRKVTTVTTVRHE